MDETTATVAVIEQASLLVDSLTANAGTVGAVITAAATALGASKSKWAGGQRFKTAVASLPPLTEAVRETCGTAKFVLHAVGDMCEALGKAIGGILMAVHQAATTTQKE